MVLLRLYIQDKNNLVKFNLPAKVDGSMLFSFKSSVNGIENSINIDSNDEKWILKSNGNINIIGSNGSSIDSVVLSDYMCVPVSMSGVQDYLTIFCIVYSETQLSFLMNYIIGIIDSFLFSLVFSFIASFLRYISLKFKFKQLYNISKYLSEKF